MSTETLTQITADIQNDRRSGALVGITKVLTDFLTGVPGLGQLAEQEIGQLAKFSAYGKIKAELAKLDAEAAEHERAALVAEAVHATLAEYLNGLSEGQQAIAEALARLDAWLEATRHELAGGRDSIHQALVSGGTGVILEGRGGPGADIKQDHITGARTVGVRIKRS